MSGDPTTVFIAGTDTDVGKTFVTALLAEFYRHSVDRVGVYKPVASGCVKENGCLVATDAVILWNAAGRPKTLEEVCPQRFEAPLAPPQAAAAENRQVDRALLRDGARCWEQDVDVLLIEGTGGLMSPLADGMLNLELVQQFDSPRLVIVAANRLGAIHQTLATCFAAIQKGVTPDAIVLCNTDRRADDSASSNAEQIARYTDVPVLGQVPFEATIDDVSFAQKLVH